MFSRWIPYVLLAGLAGAFTISAQVSHEPGASSATAVITASVGNPSVVLNPIEQFRRLMAMDPAERDRSLAGKPEAKRKLLENKIKEYTALPSAERENRLQVLQLRFYLEPLMQIAPAQRTSKVATIPADFRRLVEERLTEWDMLPPPMQKEVLETQTARLYFVRLEGTTSAERQVIWKDFPRERQEQLEEQLAHWRALPQEQRGRMYSLFDHFFELKPEEKEKTLDVLPEDQRQQMEKLMSNFGALPRVQRLQYLVSFRKFANMTPEERERFLANAQRWRAMTPAERQTWNEMVTALPPLPPGMEFKTDGPPLPH